MQLKMNDCVGRFRGFDMHVQRVMVFWGWLRKFEKFCGRVVWLVASRSSFDLEDEFWWLCVILNSMRTVKLVFGVRIARWAIRRCVGFLLGWHENSWWKCQSMLQDEKNFFSWSSRKHLQNIDFREFGCILLYSRNVKTIALFFEEIQTIWTKTGRKIFNFANSWAGQVKMLENFSYWRIFFLQFFVRLAEQKSQRLLLNPLTIFFFQNLRIHLI